MHEVPRLIVHADSPSTKERDPYARIRKMPEIRSVELSSAFSQAESPDTLDFSSFGASAADVQKTYATMYEWLATPFIEDTFTDHRDRRIWRQALSATDLALMRRNKFRNNLAGVVTALLQYLPQDVSSKGGSFKRRIEACLKNEPSLDSLIAGLPKAEGVEERRRLLKQLEKKIIDVLGIVAQGAVSIPPASHSRSRIKESTPRKAA